VFEVEEGLTITAQNTNVCPEPLSPEHTMRCDISSIPAGGSSVIEFTGRVALANAREDALLDMDAEYTHAGPHLDEDMQNDVAGDFVEVSDQDLDGVIDVDDAFASDDRYSLDSDGDGMANLWEEENGFELRSR